MMRKSLNSRNTFSNDLITSCGAAEGLSVTQGKLPTLPRGSRPGGEHKITAHISAISEE